MHYFVLKLNYLQKLTKEQKQVVDEIVESVESGGYKPFFIEGQGGCGKTLIYTTLFYILEGKGMKVNIYYSTIFT